MCLNCKELVCPFAIFLLSCPCKHVRMRWEKGDVNFSRIFCQLVSDGMIVNG